MEENQDQASFVDNITRFVMRQTSRRGFIKWLGKGGLALAGSVMAGFRFLGSTAFAAINCSEELPGCEGDCTCGVSECTDLDNGETFYCEGVCQGCDEVWYYVLVFWYWSSSQNKCVQAKDCVLCDPL